MFSLIVLHLPVASGPILCLPRVETIIQHLHVSVDVWPCASALSLWTKNRIMTAFLSTPKESLHAQCIHPLVRGGNW